MGEDEDEEMIYCQWVDSIINSKLLGKYCSVHFFNGRCLKCPFTKEEFLLELKGVI